MRAMQRLRMPPAFVALVQDSLTGLSSWVRTAYGMSDAVRGAAQPAPGGPAGPAAVRRAAWTRCTMGWSATHSRASSTGCSAAVGGGRVAATLPSLGYADDTTVLANSLASLRIQNDWVHYFMAFNEMRLNPAKCELVGRTADGSRSTAAAVAAAGITIEGHAIEPVPHDRSPSATSACTAASTAAGKTVR